MIFQRKRESFENRTIFSAFASTCVLQWWVTKIWGNHGNTEMVWKRNGTRVLHGKFFVVFVCFNCQMYLCWNALCALTGSNDSKKKKIRKVKKDIQLFYVKMMFSFDLNAEKLSLLRKKSDNAGQSSQNWTMEKKRFMEILSKRDSWDFLKMMKISRNPEKRSRF